MRCEKHDDPDFGSYISKDKDQNRRQGNHQIHPKMISDWGSISVRAALTLWGFGTGTKSRS